MLPDKDTRCHRTGFEKTCFECVTQHGCRLWKRVSEIVDRHPETGDPIAKDKFDCIDSIAELFYKDTLRRQLQTTATVDKLAKEVRESNAGAMGAILGSVNQQVRRLADHANGVAHDDTKLIENKT